MGRKGYRVSDCRGVGCLAKDIDIYWKDGDRRVNRMDLIQYRKLLGNSRCMKRIGEVWKIKH